MIGQLKGSQYAKLKRNYFVVNMNTNVNPLWPQQFETIIKLMNLKLRVNK